jgi:predicted secreted protein
MIKMNILFLIIFIILAYSKIKSNDEEFRIVKLKDFTGENSYLPVKCGQKFTIEIEGNPTTGFQWSLESKSESIKDKLLTPLNLNEKNQGDYYSYNKKSADSEIKRLGVGGIYHFKFQSDENKSGYEELAFIYKRPWTDDGSTKQKITVKIVKLDDKKDL